MFSLWVNEYLAYLAAVTIAAVCLYILIEDMFKPRD